MASSFARPATLPEEDGAAQRKAGGEHDRNILHLHPGLALKEIVLVHHALVYSLAIAIFTDM